MMVEYKISGTKYYFYPSHYVIYSGETYNITQYGMIPGSLKLKCIYIIKGEPCTPIVVFKADSGNVLQLYPDGVFHFRKGGAGMPQPTGYKIDVTTIASQGELKFYKAPEAEIPLFPPEDIEKNGENELSTAGFPVIPILIAVVLLGIGATLFATTKKKRKKK